MSVQSVTNLSRKVTPYFSTTGVGTFFFEANNDVNTLMGYKFYGKDYYPAGSNWANTESILEGSYAYTSSGIQIIGTMPNNGELNYKLLLKINPYQSFHPPVVKINSL